MSSRSIKMIVLAAVLVCLKAMSASAADRVVAAGFKGPSISLIDILQVVDSDSRQVAIDVPADGSGQKSRMTLKAKAKKGPFRWAVFTLANPELIARDFVLVLPRQSFIDSGVLWPRPSVQKAIAVSTSSGVRPRQLNVREAEAFSISIEPGRAASFAIELTPAILSRVELWHRAEFEKRAGQLAFFNGVVLGIAILLGVAILSLFVVRQVAVFPAAGLFAWSSIAFMLINAGYLGALPARLSSPELFATLRGVVESLMLIGLSMTLVTLLQLRQNAPLFRMTFIATAAIGLGLATFSFFDAAISTGVARIVFAMTAAMGLATSFVLWRQNISRAKTSLLVWIIVFLWTLVAALGVLALVNGDVVAPIIAAGLVLILVVISFTIAQLAFGRSIASRHFLEDSGRRALALAGSEQSVWDWQVTHQILYIGPELERALGLEHGTMGGTNLDQWLEIIHPQDRGAYTSAIEAAERRGKGAFSQEFRLRRADGTYRWYLLRARAIIGEDKQPTRLIGTLTDVTAVKRSEDRMLADAVRDRVTGLPNRALFIDRLERAIRRARSKGGDELFVLVIDLDRFKSVNDGLGYEVGDSLLNVTARRLAKMIGPDDTLARLAGDQFGIIFNGETPDDEIIEVTDNIRQIVAMPINVRPREIFLTASIGIAQFEPSVDDAVSLVKHAEIALFEAKRKGKDQVEYYRATMHDDRSHLVALESDLRRAIDRGEIEVFYQPIKRLVDGELAGFEALVRWRHPKRGLLAPDAFIAMAEETGIIAEVGRYVLNEAARQLGIWQRAFRPSDPLFVAVNVSSAQLLSYELIADLKALLSREDIVPGTLKLELTETMVMQNPEIATKVLERAVGLGVGLACDDFGTGYSALANLSRLPFDTLKVDKAFIDRDGFDERSTIVLDSIIHLAHNLNLNVVAEGIEEQEQLDRLTARGCDYAQGFLIGEPVSSDRVIQALGGLPYSQTTSSAGLTLLWDRLLGKTPVDTDTSAELPDDDQRAAEVAELERQEEPLEPWSPESEDVYDPAIEEIEELEPQHLPETEPEVEPEMPPNASELEIRPRPSARAIGLAPRAPRAPVVKEPIKIEPEPEPEPEQETVQTPEPEPEPAPVAKPEAKKPTPPILRRKINRKMLKKNKVPKKNRMQKRRAKSSRSRA